MFTKIFNDSEASLKQAAELLQQGELIAFPTETVYGLAAPIFSEKSIAKIFQVKNRPQDNPLIAHISDIQEVESIAREIPPLFFQLSELFFPGPLTLVIAKNPRVPSQVSAGRDSIAVRMPNHPVALNFIKKVGVPLVAPSANLSGKPSPTHLDHVVEDFEGKIAGIIDGGQCSLGVESTVLSLLDPQKPLLLRPGTLTVEEIEAKISIKISTNISAESSFLAPGMRYRHYAPLAKVVLFETQAEVDGYINHQRPLKRLIFSPTCHNLYTTFRRADKEGYEEIVVILPHTKEVALRNRLFKAVQ